MQYLWETLPESICRQNESFPEIGSTRTEGF
jgi:hypothetical protein